MQLEKISLQDSHSFSPFFLDYIQGAEQLRPFYGQVPKLENFGQQISEKSSFPASTRNILVETLQRQYETITGHEAVAKNIQLLKDGNTFTITTGHQLNIFTGPLYFIYKIITAINTCEALRQQYPDYRFVPVYWMASEDHDFEEISSFRLYGKKYQWNTKQTGAVGRFDPRELEGILSAIPGDASVFKDAYLGHTTLSNAARAYVNSLFGEYGVVVVDADDRALKNLLIPVMEMDLFQSTIKDLVEKDTSSIQQFKYHTQINARDINFFYLDGDIRDRIEQSDDVFTVINQKIQFTREELQKLVLTEPEKFSPNVILRPLYQEIILPNLAYIGGPSEVIYWLQLKNLFTYFKIPFPVLMPRNFAVVIDLPLHRKLLKTGLSVKDLFEPINYIFNHWLLKNTGSYDLSLSEAIGQLKEVFKKVKGQAEMADITLGALVASKGQQTLNQLEKIEAKMLRAEKRKQADKIGQIQALKDALFPNGNLQERTDNFLNFYQQNPDFIKDAKNAFDPFDFRLHALIYAD